MKLKTIIIFTVVLLLATPTISLAQYLNKLYDYDSTFDWGWDIFINPDSTFFVIGSTANNPFNGIWSCTNMTISANGNTIVNKNRYADSNSSIYNGDPGTVKKLTLAGYLSALTINTPNITYNNSGAGFMRFNSAGDTTFFKTYTDTSIFYEFFYDCAITTNGKYLGAGGHSYNGVNDPSTVLGFILCTDSLGNLLWTHTYQKDTSQWVYINRIIPLDDGRIAIGAQSSYWTNTTYSYTHNTPWFIIADSVGNIMKDTLYGDKYAGGGYVYNDSHGGYIHIGQIDTLITANPNDYENFPNYIAHLDSNFRMEWITRFPYDSISGHRYIVKAKQLYDSNFFVCGVAAFYNKNQLAWGAKISKNGYILWEHYFVSDSSQNITQFKDIEEKTDGSLFFIGCTMNDTLPSWRTNEDIWLLEVDSNGCEIPGCSITRVASPLPSPGEPVSLWPNPTTGEFTLKCPQSGTVILYNMQGQQVMENKVMAGATNLRLPSGAGAGVYMVKYMGEGNNGPVVLRLVYEP